MSPSSIPSSSSSFKRPSSPLVEVDIEVPTKRLHLSDNPPSSRQPSPCPLDRELDARTDSEDEDEVRRLELDKGKGKAVELVITELPEEVWRRIFQFHLGNCERAWHDRGTLHHALAPLLLCHSLTGIALPVLYAHPLLSHATIAPFLRSLNYPSRYAPNRKDSYVRHLTLQASPRIPPPENFSAGGILVHKQVGELLSSLPDLITFTLKDTLILNGGDARLIFEALRCIQPKKVRLEFRMWDLHSSTTGQDLIAATQPSIHSNMTKPPGVRSLSDLEDRRRPRWDVSMQTSWLEALWAGRELHLPSFWTDPPRQNINHHDPNAPQPPLPPAILPLPMSFPPALATPLPASLPFGAPSWMGMFGTLGSHPALAPPLPLVDNHGAINLAAPPVSRSAGVLDDEGESSESSHDEDDRPLRLRRSAALSTSQQTATQPRPTNSYGRTAMARRRARAVPDPLQPMQTVSDNSAVSAGTPVPAATPSIPPPCGPPDSPLGLVSLPQDRAISRQSFNPDADLMDASSIGSRTYENFLSSLERTTFPSIDDIERLRRSPLASAAAPRVDPSAEQANLAASGPGDSSAGDEQTSVDMDIRAFRDLMDDADDPPAPASGQTSRTRVQASRPTESRFAQLTRSLRAAARTHPRGFASRTAHQPSALSVAATSRRLATGARLAPSFTTFNVDSQDQAPSPSSSGYFLAHEMRRSLLSLLQAWSPTLQAVSIVAFDPLASLIVRAPTLDLWTNVPVPHIRVQLPRAINSLAMFKGTKELARDRLRERAQPNRADPDSDDDGGREREADREYRVVGGDGQGGELLHDDVRLFEIEVNTAREMNDEVWMRYGAQLPPQVCRILAGEQDWADVPIGPQCSTPTIESREFDSSLSQSSDGLDSPTFTFASLDSGEGGISGDEGNVIAEAGETYDVEAARRQRERNEHRSRGSEISGAW